MPVYTAERWKERDKKRERMVSLNSELYNASYAAEHDLPTGELMNPWNYERMEKRMGKVVDEMKMIRSGEKHDVARDTESHTYDWRKRRRPKK